MNWEAFWLTVRLAAIVSTLLIAIGIPIAYWLTYSRWRWKFLAEAAVALPIVLPPTVLGFYVLVALGSRSPLGRWWESLTGHTLAFTLKDWSSDLCYTACPSLYNRSLHPSARSTAGCFAPPHRSDIRRYKLFAALCYRSQKRD